MNHIMFYAAALLATISTAMVIFSRNAVYAVLYLIVSLGAVALVFFTLGANFLAAVEVIVYAGAIMVLFLFVVMMLNLGRQTQAEDLRRPSRKQMVVPGILVVALLLLTFACLSGGTPQAAGQVLFSPKELGHALFTRHFLGVKLAGIILLIGTIGGMHIGRAASQPDTMERQIDAASQ
jgi:NADH-quinone oxidoreductase subunit J